MSRPTLTGERVVLTPMSWDHLEDLCALDADPEVMRFLGPPRSRADTWDHPLPGSEQGEVVYELDRETWASR